MRKISSNSIEFNGNNSNLLTVIDAINYDNDTDVVVPMTHTALIIENGGLRETVSGGSVPLFKNARRSGCLFGWFRGGKKKPANVRSIKVIYISKTARLLIRWGTNSNHRVSYEEPTSSLDVSVGAFGMTEICVKDAAKFYSQLVAADGDYSLGKLEERIRTITVNETFRTVKQILAMRRPTYKELDYVKDEMQDRAESHLAEKFVDEYGFEVTNFIIEKIGIDDESLNEIKKRNIEDSTFAREETVYGREKEAERRRKRDMVEDIKMDDLLYSTDLTRRREQEEYLRKNRHEDEDRAWAREDRKEDRAREREDKKIESEERRNSMYFDAVKEAGWEGGPEKKNSGASGAHHCTVCGASYKPGAKYCPDCGATLPSESLHTRCLRCGAQMPWGTKYCPVCGEKVDGSR